ncbi:hypothetical protein OJAV_G00012440 [Oryzias javanicus]|uniref:Alanine--tRNA ligase n=1 Tax=Oryzias javanicus TaxID=123683 RepID=A0A3S2N9W1_ORYJA|nr:hypothetical protein OJAV_G00012440 [Oryzias javanicus]
MAAYRRVVNSQKCVRAGGKHNDLEDVGRDVYHHTFFEMLGNWSFGDYFKAEACQMAWSLLTEHYGIPAERLYVSYFGGDAVSGLPADEETRSIWMDAGVSPGRVLPFGLTDNFWEMGDSGPCGPCTEIHFDHVGGPRRRRPVQQGSGLQSPAAAPVQRGYRDGTGAPGERPAGQTLQLRTDLFTPLLRAIHQRAGVGPYSGGTGADRGGQVDLAYRVVADHIRTLSVCIADGVHPGMSGAELVLRRILRRAVRFCTQVLRAPQGTLASLVPTVTQLLGDAYPELKREEHRIMEVINENEDQFLASLQHGSRIIHRTLQNRECRKTGFPASVAWTLHRDLGFPLDLVDMMLEEKGVQVNRQDLDRLISENQKVASEKQAGVRSHVTLDVHILAELQRLQVPHSDDSLKYQYGLEKDRYVFPACSATILALSDGQTLLQEVPEGRRCAVILDRTCFYAEQGGQSHDLGYLTCGRLQDVVFPVERVVQVGGYVVHQVTATENLRTGDRVRLHLDETLLHGQAHGDPRPELRPEEGSGPGGPSARLSRGGRSAALRLQREGLSERAAAAAGGKVRPGHRGSQSGGPQPELPVQRARSIRGLRTVDEVYPDPVRVVSLHVPVQELLDSPSDPDTSVELCCGTHLLRTGTIEDLVIVSEKQMVKGISRLVAVTGRDAAQAREAGQDLSQEVDSLTARMSGSSPSSISSAQRFSKEASILSDAVDNTPIPQWQRQELQSRLKALLRTSNTAVRKLELREAAQKAQAVLEKNGRKALLVDSVEAESLSVLMKTVNQLSSAAPLSHVMLLARHAPSGKVLCACQVPKDTPILAASDWAVAVCGYLGGSAGGSALVAKGTGTANDITETLRWAEDFVAQKRQR